MEPTYGDYDEKDVDSLEKLKDRLQEADGITDLSHILSDYISWGNNKVADSVAIFNMNAATDCPNADTDRCQVPWSDCYAHKSENVFPNTLPYRRRQEYLWDALAPEEWAAAFKEIVSRKRKEVTAIRFSEAGDFRHDGDVRRVDRIAELLEPEGIDVYTYSASSHIDWSEREHFTLNASNDDLREEADRRFGAVPTEDDIPEDAVHCPFDKQTNEGQTEGRRKCGECRACLTEDAGDIYITVH